LLVAPLARAQGAKVFRVAWVLTTSPIAELAGPEPSHPITRAFVHEMRALGYAEGRNLVLERRSAEGNPERFAPIFAELLALQPDVIVMAGHAALNRLAKETIRTIPIVIFAMSAPVQLGLVNSLARPGGNITGLTVNAGPEIEAKRLQLLEEAIPRATRVAYLGTHHAWNSAIGQAVRKVAAELGVTLAHAVHRPDDLEATFANVMAQRPHALFASLSAETYGQRGQIVEFARRARLPGIYPYLEMAALGGLLAYGVDVVELGRQGARYVDRILKGAQAGELPINRPTKFDLVINLRSARELGLELPRSVLLRADRTIG
jgi:ABC-type uncharacterized transport system substrate-binding protein